MRVKVDAMGQSKMQAVCRRWGMKPSHTPKDRDETPLLFVDNECAIGLATLVGVMHGFWFWFHFFCGLFSKDASVFIGSFSPRTQLFRCNNVT